MVSFASFLLWFWMLRKYLASRLGVFSFMTPLFGMLFVACTALFGRLGQNQRRSVPPAAHPIVLHAARVFDTEAGRIVTPGEVLVQGERILEAGSSVQHPVGAETMDLGDVTLLAGLIDAHVHLFLHPGAEDLQTIEESVPQRTITATLAARDDLLAGFTSERDMGTEGAGSADTAVRNAINQDLDQIHLRERGMHYADTALASAIVKSRFRRGWHQQQAPVGAILKPRR